MTRSMNSPLTFLSLRQSVLFFRDASCFLLLRFRKSGKLSVYSIPNMIELQHVEGEVMDVLKVER